MACTPCKLNAGTLFKYPVDKLVPLPAGVHHPMYLLDKANVILIYGHSTSDWFSNTL